MAPVTSRRGRGFGAAPEAGIGARDAVPYGWAPFVVLFLVGLVDRVEYSLTSGVLPLIQAEWKFSDTAAGFIPTAGAIAAALVALPAGYLADRYSRTRIIAVVVFVWALATLGSGLATGFAIFFLMRVVLAAAENIDNPCSSSLLADFYPPVNRPKVFGWVRVTTYLGGIGVMLGGVLGEAFGWRSAFLVMVVPGLLVAALAWRLREPPRGFLDRVVADGGEERVPVPTSGAAAEVSGLKQRLPGPNFWPQLRNVLKIPTLVLVACALSIHIIGVGGTAFWFPTLMVREFGVGTGTAASLAGGISVVGVVVGTMAGAWLGRRARGRIKGGMLVVAGGGIAAGACLLGLTLTMTSFQAFAVLLLISNCLMAMSIPNAMAAIADTLPADSRGIGFAIIQCLMTAGTAVGPVTVGIVSDATGSLLQAVSIFVLPMIVGGTATLVLGRMFYDRDAAKVMAAARTTAGSEDVG